MTQPKMMLKVRVVVLLLCIISVALFLKGHVPDLFLEKALSEDDQWFMQRLNRSVEPFLSANHSLSEDAFSWWKGLQAETRDIVSYNTTVDNMFKIFPSTPDVADLSPDSGSSCAVVGNSHNLKGSRYGPLIDFHDVVIRINFGQTSGYETDVGNKTTHRIMYPESAMDLDNTTHLVLVPFKIQDLEWLIKAFTTGFTGRSYMAVKSKIKANKNLVMVVNPGFMKYVHNTWLEKKGKYPSTGFMALILALHLCDKVHVFGYGADKDGNWSHYWEKLKDQKLKTGVHPGNHEYDMIQQLAMHQKLKFYTGW